MEYRGTGRTTQQMIAAPHGAVFVWCNSNITYPKMLAQDLRRDDIVVRPLSWLKREKVIGQTFAVY